MVTGSLSTVINEGIIDWAKNKYKKATTYDQERYDKWTTKNKNSKWNKLNNRFFKVQDKHGETVIGGALKSGIKSTVPAMYMFGPTPTLAIGTLGALSGAYKAHSKRKKLKKKYGKIWQEDEDKDLNKSE